MRTSRFLLALFAVAAVAPAASAQRSSQEWLESCFRNNHRGDGRAVHCEVGEQRIPARSTLRVDGAQNGGVAVRMHEGRDIIVRTRTQTQGRTETEAREVARRIRVSTDGAIRATGPNTRGNGWSVSYEILVPARTNLEVETTNGPITVERVSGDIDLSAVNGPIALTEVSGDVRARAQNGPINVRLAGRRWSGAGLDAETVNGPVTVRIPRGYAAHLESGTVHGPLNVPEHVRPRREGRRPWSTGGRISTDINGGGPTIRAVTTNGPVRIEEI